MYSTTAMEYLCMLFHTFVMQLYTLCTVTALVLQLSPVTEPLSILKIGRDGWPLIRTFHFLWKLHIFVGIICQLRA